MTDRFGWCLDDGHADHEHCRVEYVDWNGKTRTCGCPCHQKA